MSRRAGLVCTVALLSAGAVGADAVAAPATLDMGFNDTFLIGRADRTTWTSRMAPDGARDLRINGYWSVTAPTRPPSAAQARDPSWSGYDFSAMDDGVRRAAAAGLRPLIVTVGAPGWAEGPGRPAAARPGTWKPDAAAYGLFMQAVAARYDGTRADPAAPGRRLPRVREFQAWNEPNLVEYLTPQWVNRTPASPGIFRALQNAAYRGVKAAQPRATVVAAGTSPFGDTPAGSPRMRPVRFWRETFCLSRSLRRTCRAKTQTDVVAQHPYLGVGTPARGAYNRDDMSVADVHRLVELTRAARRTRSLGPRRPKVWVTEFGVRSAPPTRKGAGVHSLSVQARYVAESSWRLWRQGVSRIYWLTNVDERDARGVSTGHGTYQPNGRAKPSVAAVRFPVYAPRATGSRLSVWARPPIAGRMTVEVRRGGRWATAKRLTVKRGAPRTVGVAASRVTAVRARVGRTTSYVWSVR